MTALPDFIARTLGTTAFRLAATSMAAFLLGSAVVAALLFWQTNAVLTEQALQTIESEAAALKRVEKNRGPQALIDAVRVRSLPEGPGLYFLADSQGVKLGGNLSRVPPEIAGNPQGGVFSYDAGNSERASRRLGVAVPVVLRSGASLLIGRDIEEQRAFASRLKRIVLWSFMGLGLVGLAAGLAVSRMALKRIETITSASRAIMAGNLSERIPRNGSGDELDDLALNLNDMLERIEQLMGGLKEVSDNIAHDLKTPLNRMRNRAEAALRDARGADACREGLEQTIEDADELIKTFNALLLIARLEAGAVEETARSFDLGVLVRDVAELYEPVAEEAGLVLTIEAGSGPTIKANSQLVGQAVANLVDNAIKYGTQSGATTDSELASIAVRVVRGQQGAEISVADHGPGIESGDRDRVLKRFVRLEKSRTRPGTGLGLSLVAAVARLHGGHVRLEDNAPGLRVVLVLPG